MIETEITEAKIDAYLASKDCSQLIAEFQDRFYLDECDKSDKWNAIRLYAAEQEATALHEGEVRDFIPLLFDGIEPYKNRTHAECLESMSFYFETWEDLEQGLERFFQDYGE